MSSKHLDKYLYHRLREEYWESLVRIFIKATHDEFLLNQGIPAPIYITKEEHDSSSSRIIKNNKKGCYMLFNGDGVEYIASLYFYDFYKNEMMQFPLVKILVTDNMNHTSGYRYNKIYMDVYSEKIDFCIPKFGTCDIVKMISMFSRELADEYGELEMRFLGLNLELIEKVTMIGKNKFVGNSMEHETKEEV